MTTKRIALTFLVAGLAALLGLSNASADAGDDAFVAFMSRDYTHALDLAGPATLPPKTGPYES
jgi:hypothetical protein